jgi:ornithine cyclodeaminase
MRVIDADTTRRHLGAAQLIEALRQMFITGCEVPLRHTHTVGEGTLLLMPAWRAGQRLGLKTVTIFPGNSAIGQPGLYSTYLLFDASTGVPLAQLDGDQITSRRTAAASALAASFLARTDASHLLIVGTGRVASLIAEAMQVVRPLTEVLVWNHRAPSAEALASRLREQGFKARASTDLAAAVAAADIVSCATPSTTALIRGEWLQPGAHLDLIGSFTLGMCEADAACFERSRVFVDTPEALAKSGDVLRAVEAGAFKPGQLAGTLAELCRGTRPGRGSATQITLFKAVGSALEDLAAAELVWGRVQAESLSLAPAPFTDRTP